MNKMPSLNKIISIITVLVMVWSSPAFGGGNDNSSINDIAGAVAAGDLAKATTILKHNPDSISWKDPLVFGTCGGHTLLHVAEQYQRKDMAELLLAKKAEVNAKDVQGWTPLDWAAEKHHEDVAELLRQHGGTNYLFAVEMSGVADKLISRRYKISPSTFFGNFQHKLTPQDGESDIKLLRRFFKEHHIETRMFLNDRLGFLHVAVFAPEEQKEIEKLVDEIANAK